MNNPIDKLSLQNQLNKPKNMEQTNKLPSRFQILDEVMWNNEEAKITVIQFMDSKLEYGVSVKGVYKGLKDTSEISPKIRNDKSEQSKKRSWIKRIFGIT